MKADDDGSYGTESVTGPASPGPPHCSEPPTRTHSSGKSSSARTSPSASSARSVTCSGADIPTSILQRSLSTRVELKGMMVRWVGGTGCCTLPDCPPVPPGVSGGRIEAGAVSGFTGVGAGADTRRQHTPALPQPSDCHLPPRPSGCSANRSQGRRRTARQARHTPQAVSMT